MYAIRSYYAKRDLVYPKRINPLTTGPGMPRYIDGSRTLKSTGNFPSSYNFV